MGKGECWHLARLVCCWCQVPLHAMEMKLLFERMSSFKAEKMLEMVSVTSLYNLYRQPDSPALAVMFQGLRVYETERGCGKAY